MLAYVAFEWQAREVMLSHSHKLKQPIGRTSVRTIIEHVKAGTIPISPKMMLEEATTHPEGKRILPYFMGLVHHAPDPNAPIKHIATSTNLLAPIQP